MEPVKEQIVTYKQIAHIAKRSDGTFILRFVGESISAIYPHELPFEHGDKVKITMEKVT